jgi:hypothetical protein
MGGQYPDGLLITQTGEVYFEVGDRFLVHLARNPLLYGRLQIVGSYPGGRQASVFSVERIQGKDVLVSLYMDAVLRGEPLDEDFLERNLGPTTSVSAQAPRIFKYQELQKVYQNLRLSLSYAPSSGK